MTDSVQEQLRCLMDGVGPGEDATPDILELNGIVKRYGDFVAVDGLDLRVPRGEIFGFLGPNGAGKTTTIRMVAGVLEPTEGSVMIGGYDLATHPVEAKSRIGYIPDRPFLYEKLSGGEFLRFVAGLWGKDEPASEDRADGLLEIFNLLEWKHELIETYSHGMRQKLLITSALIHQPELIVVDEPMVGLDPRSARILKDLFRVYVERGGHRLSFQPHTRGRGGGVRPDRHSQRGCDHRPGNDGRPPDAGGLRWCRSGGDLPEGHGKRGHGRGRGRSTGVTPLTPARRAV